ncbi:MAG: type IV toxin-antitoxin system AbiEi family antitoxin domain-containing protein [Planctomycetota bacterium]|jgi:predicted transcriptional regulator of viral defense system
MISSPPDKTELYHLAESQQGLFTTKQAKACGYAENTHHYHVGCGHWIRERRGIYRLALFPVSAEEQFVLWSLWSSNRNEEVQGVYSHATALAIHELSDIMPDRLHMTVPKSFRRFKEPPAVLILHKTKLTPDEIELRQGYSITTPLRTLKDISEDVAIPDDIIEQAVRDAFRSGIITKAMLTAATLPSRLIEITGGGRP